MLRLRLHFRLNRIQRMPDKRISASKENAADRSCQKLSPDAGPLFAVRHFFCLNSKRHSEQLSGLSLELRDHSSKEIGAPVGLACEEVSVLIGQAGE